MRERFRGDSCGKSQPLILICSLFTGWGGHIGRLLP
nr:MAG TPA: hypothetical protein [Caudoviricetes sp.]DAW91773.1 MAG TPA: hypothetical protein [Caudoviricetes sp.]